MISTLPADPTLDYMLVAGLNVRPGDVVQTPTGRARIVRIEGIWAAVERVAPRPKPRHFPPEPRRHG